MYLNPAVIKLSKLFMTNNGLMIDPYLNSNLIVILVFDHAIPYRKELCFNSTLGMIFIFKGSVIQFF